MKIYLANDHRGVKLKGRLVKYLNKKGYEVIDLGTDKSIPVDYPEYGFKISEKVCEDKNSLGIAICGSGIGISIACNKVKGIRCAKVANAKEARLSRIDNDANIVALSGNISYIRALDIVDAFIETKHNKIERHDKRIALINKYENKFEKKENNAIVKNKELKKETIKIIPPIPKVKIAEKKEESKKKTLNNTKETKKDTTTKKKTETKKDVTKTKNTKKESDKSKNTKKTPVKNKTKTNIDTKEKSKKEESKKKTESKKNKESK